jgi:hypothetical protein
MVKSHHVAYAKVATPLQAVVLRACLDTWQRPTGLGASPTAVARRRLLARLVRRGWLETQDRTPEQLRAMYASLPGPDAAAVAEWAAAVPPAVFGGDDPWDSSVS